MSDYFGTGKDLQEHQCFHDQGPGDVYRQILGLEMMLMSHSSKILFY